MNYQCGQEREVAGVIIELRYNNTAASQYGIHSLTPEHGCSPEVIWLFLSLYSLSWGSVNSILAQYTAGANTSKLHITEIRSKLTATRAKKPPKGPSTPAHNETTTGGLPGPVSYSMAMHLVIADSYEDLEDFLWFSVDASGVYAFLVAIGVFTITDLSGKNAV